MKTKYINIFKKFWLSVLLGSLVSPLWPLSQSEYIASLNTIIIYPSLVIFYFIVFFCIIFYFED